MLRDSQPCTSTMPHQLHTMSTTCHTQRQPRHINYCHTPCLHHTPSISTRTCQHHHINPHHINCATSTSTTYPKDEGTWEEEDKEEMGQGKGFTSKKSKMSTTHIGGGLQFGSWSGPSTSRNDRSLTMLFWHRWCAIIDNLSTFSGHFLVSCTIIVVYSLSVSYYFLLPTTSMAKGKKSKVILAVESNPLEHVDFILKDGSCKASRQPSPSKKHR